MTAIRKGELSLKASAAGAAGAIACIALFIAANARTDDKDDAKAKFSLGMSLIKDEDFVGALQAFKESYELKPAPQALFNMGMCQKALSLYVEAIESFELYLVDEAAAKNTTKREQAQEAIAEMEKSVAKVGIQGAPDGASIKVDGRERGTSPLDQPLRLNPGTHTLLLTKPGYEPFEVELVLKAAEVRVILANIPEQKGTIEVRCDDSSAKVLLNGKAAGSCGQKIEVTPGMHEITVAAEGKKRATEPVEVKPAAAAVISVRLEPEIATSAIPEREEIKEQQPKVVPSPAAKGVSFLFVGGAALGGLGLAAAGVGSYFVYMRSEHLKDGKDAAAGFALTGSADDEAAYNQAGEDMSRDQVGMVIGFAVSGALIATGAVLMFVGLDDEEDSRNVAMAPTPTGLQIRF
jgi:hypothetical protein